MSGNNLVKKILFKDFQAFLTAIIPLFRLDPCTMYKHLEYA